MNCITDGAHAVSVPTQPQLNWFYKNPAHRTALHSVTLIYTSTQRTQSGGRTGGASGGMEAAGVGQLVVKQDRLAPSVKDPPHANSTTRQNQPICSPPLYMAVICEAILHFYKMVWFYNAL